MVFSTISAAQRIHIDTDISFEATVSSGKDSALDEDGFTSLKAQHI